MWRGSTARKRPSTTPIRTSRCTRATSTPTSCGRTRRCTTRRRSCSCCSARPGPCCSTRGPPRTRSSSRCAARLTRSSTAGWPRHPHPDDYGLLVLHTHAHGDHVAADGQFLGRPDTVLVGASPRRGVAVLRLRPPAGVRGRAGPRRPGSRLPGHARAPRGGGHLLRPVHRDPVHRRHRLPGPPVRLRLARLRPVDRPARRAGASSGRSATCSAAISRCRQNRAWTTRLAGPTSRTNPPWS